MTLVVKEKPKNKTKKLKEIVLPVLVDISKLHDSEENPNEQTDATFDQLVESIREEGVDENIIAVPHTNPKLAAKGHLLIVGGHHRKKAAKIAGYKQVPVIVKETWNDSRRKTELVRRNMLHGKMDPAKFTKLFDDVAKGQDRELIKKRMGFVNKKEFEALYKEARKTLNPEQRKKLDDAKEDIKSVDDLASVLNTIFKESGSTLEQGFMVFSFGGKNHHYYQIDKQTSKILTQLESDIKKSGLKSDEYLRNVFVTHLQTADSKVSQFKAKKKPK